MGKPYEAHLVFRPEHKAKVKEIGANLQLSFSFIVGDEDYGDNERLLYLTVRESTLRDIQHRVDKARHACFESNVPVLRWKIEFTLQDSISGD